MNAFGVLYFVRITGNEYRTFRTKLSEYSHGIDLKRVFNEQDVDAAAKQTMANLGNTFLETYQIKEYKGYVYKKEKSNNTIRKYEVFFQYPLQNETTNNLDNFKFTLKVDILLRCIMKDVTVHADVIATSIDHVSTTMNNFAIKRTNESAKEEEVSSGGASVKSSKSAKRSSVSSGLSRSSASSAKGNREIIEMIEELRAENRELKQMMMHIEEWIKYVVEIIKSSNVSSK